MLFSILIANFNNGRFFKDCYNSIVNQTYRNWEVIIVDDCSTDGSVKDIKKLIKHDKRFFIYENKKQEGCGFTKNKCALLAKGEIAGFLDPDDALTEDALEIMVENHIKSKGISIITSKYNQMDSHLNYVKTCSHATALPRGKSYLTYGKAALTHFASFKLKDFFRSGGLDIKMKRAVDQDLYYKLEEQGGHLFLNKVLYYYRIHDKGISQSQNVFKARYWHLYAMKAAYRRRRGNNFNVENISEREIKRINIDYLFERLERAKKESKPIAYLYFLFSSIKAYPTIFFKEKIRNLIFDMFKQ